MVEVVTLGCRINSYESEVLKEKFKNVDNLIIVNTCAVTGEAERQCRQTIRKLRKNNPDARIVVTGCAAQIAPSKFAAMPEVDLILGNKEKTEIEKYLHNELAEKTIVGDIMSYDDCDPYLITGFEGRHRAFVQIQQGCNHRCSYCIVPYARGNSAAHRPSFSTLVQTILEEIPELPSLQFGSLDPAAIDGKFIALVGKYSNIHPHFHLSVQSGDNDVLKKMRRRHTRESVISLCGQIRQVRPEATFGADFICGFPTENDENFQNTVKLVHEAGISKLHVFPYSEPRPQP